MQSGNQQGDAQSSDSQQGQQQGQQQGGQQSQSGQSRGGSQPGQQGGQSGSQPGSSGNSSQSGGEGQQQGEGDSKSGSGGARPGEGGGLATEGSAGSETPHSSGGEETTADKANLDYTRKATDLALEYLEDQQINPDPELLERLNWSEDDLRNFVQRWRELQRAGMTGDQENQEQFERSLRSLGLGPGDSQRRNVEGTSDNQSGYQEDGRVINPPAGFAERFRAWTKRRSRAKSPRGN